MSVDTLIAERVMPITANSIPRDVALCELYPGAPHHHGVPINAIRR
jgi:hypothetical protein